MSKNLEQFAEDHFGADLDKAVPLGMLRAWLSENHWHPEPEGEKYYDDDEEDSQRPVVDSLALDEWAQSVAVTRVVDRGPYGNDKEVWSFFEHGWHKSGCEGRLTQESARVQRQPCEGPVPPPNFGLKPTGRGGYIVEGELPDDIAKQVARGWIGGYSTNENGLPEEQ